MKTTTTTTVSAPANIIIAYVLWLFLPILGIHRMYAGKIKSGVTMLILNISAIILFFTVIGILVAVPIWIGLAIWWLIDGILMLTWGLQNQTQITKTVEVQE